MVDIEFDFPLIDDTDDDTDIEFMSEVPLTIIENSIENQLNDPLEYRKKDYIKDFITKYNYMKNNEYDLEAGVVDEFHDDFMRFITNIYSEKLDLGFPNIDDASDDIQHELIHLVYDFFIKKIKKNFVTIICNELDENKSELAESVNRRKDITYNTFKDEIGDDEYAAIISNLDKVIVKILTKIRRDYDIDKFFDMCDYGEACVVKDKIKEAFDDYTITGNFIPKYVDYVMNDEFFIIDIETKVRSHILKNFPVRKIETTSNDDTDDSSINEES